MQKVVHASLNGNAYAIEEAGYEALTAYLGRAAAVPHFEKSCSAASKERRASLSLSLCDTAATALSVRPRRHEAGGAESMKTRLWGIQEGGGKYAEIRCA
jgi:hypothetical protein